ncbi:ribbon-helix-helix domain-containing protein [Roseateles chitinivorans]|uniref:ribbon-helix-helix domain-containing protein n=1 Tax=Roseateles chitinivorans TaxID=2917965 RepID=UPI003D671D16
MIEMIHTDLGPELEAIVLSLIENGKYSSRTQVLRESEELKGWRDAQAQAFKELLESRLSTPSSEYIPVEEAFDRLYRELGIKGDRSA